MFPEKRTNVIPSTIGRSMSILFLALFLVGLTFLIVEHRMRQPTEISVADALKRGKAAYEEQNYEEALRWYRKASDQNSSEAQVDIGILYEGGLHPSSEDTITKAMHGDKAEMRQLNNEDAYHTRHELPEAMRWFRKAAAQNNSQAEDLIGEFYENGPYKGPIGGLRSNPVEALRWYRKAADQNNGAAQFHLGEAYEHGFRSNPKGGLNEDHVDGVDYAEAMRWYRKAADQNIGEAQYGLGLLYAEGIAVGQNYAEAIRWYRKGADQNDMNALMSLSDCYYNGHGVPQNKSMAAYWTQKYEAAWKNGDDTSVVSGWPTSI